MSGLTPSDLVRRVDRIPPFLIVARLSLVVAIVNAHTEPVLMVAVAMVAAAVFLHERWLRSPWPWLGLAAAFGADQLVQWWLIDDHVVATTYWLAAIGLSRFGRDPDSVLASSARLLVGLLFAFAFGWKLLSSQYVSGDLWEYTLLRDDRFETVAVKAGGAESVVLDEQRIEVATFTSSGERDDSVSIETPGRTKTVATMFTWFGLAIEGLIAAAFILPLRGRWRLARPAALITFCATTYAIVPVVGFGLLLATLGAAEAASATTRRVYLSAAVLVFVWNAFLTAAVL